MAFDIFQGIGIAVALGIRPFFPSLAAGLLAAAGAEIHFDHTSYSFLQDLPFIFAMAVLGSGLLIYEAGLFNDDLEKPTWADALMTVAAAVLGALFFGANLAREGHPAWPGWIGGVICVLIGVMASRPFLARLRSRLDAEAATVGIPLIAEGSALLVAILSVLAPPVGVIALIAALVLIFRGRDRDDAKYAGLRILR
jgi:uncharacterized membrane protein